MVKEITLEKLRHILEYITGFISLSNIPDNAYYKETIQGLCNDLELLRPVDEDNPPRPKEGFCPYMVVIEGIDSIPLHCNILGHDTHTPEVCKTPFGDEMEAKWKLCPAYKEGKDERYCDMCGSMVEKTVKIMTLMGFRWMCSVCEKEDKLHTIGGKSQ